MTSHCINILVIDASEGPEVTWLRNAVIRDVVTTLHEARIDFNIDTGHTLDDLMGLYQQRRHALVILRLDHCFETRQFRQWANEIMKQWQTAVIVVGTAYDRNGTIEYCSLRDVLLKTVLRILSLRSADMIAEISPFLP